MTADNIQTKFVSGGNVRAMKTVTVLTWRRKLLIHLGVSALLFAVSLFGFWVNMPVWNLHAAAFTSGVMTAWLNLVIFITLLRR